MSVMVAPTSSTWHSLICSLQRAVYPFTNTRAVSSLSCGRHCLCQCEDTNLPLCFDTAGVFHHCMPHSLTYALARA